MLTLEEKEQLKEYCDKDPQLNVLIQHLEENYHMTLSKISHEIRNPVALINGFLQLTQTHHPEVTSFQTWTPVMENMEFLRELLEELSEYNNTHPIHKQYLSLSSLLKNLVEDCSMAFPNLNFSFHKKSAIPCDYFDLSKLRAAFLNLIRNAAESLRYTEHGKIDISIEFDGSYFQIQISDNGPQIPETYLSDLFTPFVTHKHGGSGLGLAIAANAASSHNGTISVYSTEEQTCFTLRLPFEGHP